MGLHRSRSGGARRSPAPPARARAAAAFGLAVVAVLGTGAGLRDLHREPAVTAPDLGALSSRAPGPGPNGSATGPGPSSTPTAATPSSRRSLTPKRPAPNRSTGALVPIPPAAPSALALPGQRVTAPVVPTGVRGDGELEIPESVKTVGWWVGSAPAGDTRGSTVLAGHIDSASQGVGAFAALRDVHLGDPVVLTDIFGAQHAYRVTARRTYPKYALPRGVFAGAPLVLITCGGPFDASAGRYRDNIVVYAVPS